MAKIVIFGGSGFIGSSIVKTLAQDGHIIKIVSRDKAKSSALKVFGDVGQIVCVSGSVTSDETIEKHTLGMDIVINLVGILYETHSKQFDSVHTNASMKIARYSTQAKVKQLIHFSALGIETQSKYNSSKLAGENKVTEEFPNATILRPSVVFGHNDSFFNKFGRLAMLLPFLPLVGGGKSLMQPVYVGDIANFVQYIINNKIVKKQYELAGPKRYSFKELMLFVIKTTNRKCFLLNIPFSMAKFISWFLEFSLVSLLLKPITGSIAPILTRDQVDLLKHNNISNQKDLELIGKTPTKIEEIVPDYLTKYQKTH